jgi:hypothetical protein
VVGVYPLTVRGEGIENLGEAIRSGEGPGPDVCERIELDVADYTDTKHAYLDPTTALALACACGAADDAGWVPGAVPVGLSFGTAFGCATSLATHEKTVAEKGGRLASPFIFSHAYPNSPNSVVSIDLGLTEYNACFVCASPSGAVAVGCAFDQIVLEREKRILAGGADSPPRGAAPGTTPGACFLALQDEASAREDGRSVRATLLAWRCGMKPVEDLLASAMEEAGLTHDRLEGTAGNVEIGKRNLCFDGVHGHIAGASAVLDIASLCALRPGEPTALPGRSLAVLRRDEGGLTAVILLELPRY